MTPPSRNCTVTNTTPPCEIAIPHSRTHYRPTLPYHTAIPQHQCQPLSYAIQPYASPTPLSTTPPYPTNPLKEPNRHTTTGPNSLQVAACLGPQLVCRRTDRRLAGRHPLDELTARGIRHRLPNYLPDGALSPDVVLLNLSCYNTTSNKLPSISTHNTMGSGPQTHTTARRG